MTIVQRKKGDFDDPIYKKYFFVLVVGYDHIPVSTIQANNPGYFIIRST